MRRAFAALLLLLLATAPASAQIVNGSFEPATGSIGYALLPGGSTSIPGWTTTDNGAEWHRPTPVSPSGGDAVDLACYVYSAGGVRQTIPTVSGQTYAIDFWLGTQATSGRDGTCEIVVDAAGTTQTFNATSVTATMGWFARTFTFVATGPSATLRFRCLQNANLHFAYIDGARMNAVTAAESGTWGRLKRLYR